MARRKRNKTEDRSLPKVIVKQKYTIQAAPSSGKCPWGPTNTKIIEPIQIETPTKENKTKKTMLSNKKQTNSKQTKTNLVERNEKKHEQGKEKEEILDSTVETQTALSTDDSSSQCSFTFAPVPPPSPNNTNYNNDSFQSQLDNSCSSSSTSSTRSRQINNIFNTQLQNKQQIQQSYKSVTMLGTSSNSSKNVKYLQKRSQSQSSSNEKSSSVNNELFGDDKMQYSEKNNIVLDNNKIQQQQQQQQQQVSIHDKKHDQVQKDNDSTLIDNNASIKMEKTIPNQSKNMQYYKIIVPIQMPEPRNVSKHSSVAYQNAQHVKYYENVQNQDLQKGCKKQLTRTYGMSQSDQQYVQYAQHVQYDKHAEQSKKFIDSCNLQISNPSNMSHEHVQYVGDTSQNKDLGDGQSSQGSQDTKLFELQQQQQYLSDKLVYWAMCNFCQSSPKDSSNFDLEGSFSRLRSLQCYGPGRFGGNLDLKTNPYFRM